MRVWTGKLVGAFLLIGLLAVWGSAQPPGTPFIGQIKVEISPAEAGTVSLNPEGDRFGDTYYYTSPTEVLLTASHGPGYAFLRWEVWRSEEASGDPEIRTGNTTTISLTSQYPDWTVRAVFVQQATITVKKTVVGPAPATDWEFTGTAPIGSFTLDKAGGQTSFQVNPNQSYTITETTKSGYAVTYKINDGEPQQGNSVTVTPDPGQTVVIEFINTAQPATITVKKTVVGAPPDTAWQFTGDLGSFTLPAEGGERVFEVDAGTYTITEITKPGYVCTVGGQTTNQATVTVAPGESKTVTFVNTLVALFAEDFEDITGWTLSGLWHRCDKICAWDCNAPLQGKYAHYAAVRDGTCTCSYDTGARTRGILTSPVITVPQNAELVLIFDFARVVENNSRATRDRTYVQIRLGRGSWRTVWSRSSRNASPECGTSGAILIRTGRYTTLQIRFVFDSVNRYNNNFPGWAVDNVRILPKELVPAGTPLAEEYVEEFEPLDEEPLFVLTVFPNPVTGRMVVFSVDGVEAEALQVEVYDLGGRLVYKAEAFGGQLTWDTLDATGKPVANGVYLVLAKVKVEGEWLAADLQRILILR